MMLLASPVNAYVINLQKDHEKRDKMCDELRKYSNVSLIVVEAVNGSTLPSSICELITGSKMWSSRKGAIGCFLSHMRVWEMILHSNSDAGIVLEDDVRINDLDSLINLPLPDDLDMLYLNNRVCPPSRHDVLRVIGLSDAVAFMKTRKRKGSGTDGYLMTRSGARKALDALRVDGLFGHADGRLFRYCFNDSMDIDPVANCELYQMIHNNHSDKPIPHIGILNAYAVCPPVVVHLAAQGSRKAFDGIS